MFWESASWFPSAYVYLVEHCVKPLLNAEPDQTTLAAQDGNFHKLAGILDARLAKHEWLTGSSPTIADIAIAAPMHMHSLQQLPLAQHKNLVRWMTHNVEKLPCWDNTYVGPGFTLKKAA
jgi:glutathione S-transferase